MKITINTIGKAKSSSHEMALAQNYLKRLPWLCSFREMEVKKSLPPEKLKDEEAALLLGASNDQAVKIILDEHGKQPDSIAFANLLRHYQDEGRHDIHFFIGGAYGHGKQIKQNADASISLGSMTWPHLLVRTMLSEQLYRAYTILNKHPYHKA